MSRGMIELGYKEPERRSKQSVACQRGEGGFMSCLTVVIFLQRHLCWVLLRAEDAGVWWDRREV